MDSSVTTRPVVGPTGNARKLRAFISYSRHDSAFVDRLQAALSSCGIEAFVDREHIEKSEAWWVRIQQLITEADSIIFALSPESVDSEVCNAEVEFAESLNKRLLPILVRKLEGRPVPAGLARLNYVDFVPKPTLPDPELCASSGFEPAIGDLVRALETDIPWIREHTRLGALAERWEARKRPSDLLLRGAELRSAETWLTTRPEKAPDPTDAHRALITLSRQAGNKRQRILIGGALAGLVTALGLAGVALWQRGAAMEQRAAALLSQSRTLAGFADRHTSNHDALTGLLTALEALPDSSSADAGPQARPLSPEALVAGHRAFWTSREVALWNEQSVGKLTLSDESKLLGLSKDGKLVVGLTDGTNGVKEIARLHVSAGDESLGHIEITSDGNWALTSSDKLARLWNLSTGEQLATYTVGASRLRQATIAPDRGTVIVTEWDGVAHVYEPDGRLRFRVSSLSGGENMHIGAFSPDSKQLALGMDDGSVHILDTHSGRLLRKLRGHASAVFVVHFSPDGRFIATGSSDKTIWLRDAATGSQVAHLLGHRREVDDIAFSPDGQLLLTKDFDQKAALWSLPSGKNISWFEGLSNIHAGNFSYDSKLVVTAHGEIFGQSDADYSARVWDARSGHLLEVLRGHESGIHAATFTHDMRHVLTVSGDGTARLWRLGSATPVLRHNQAAASIALSPTGSLLVAGEGDYVERGRGGATVWDANHLTKIESLSGFSDRVEHLAFSPDGEILAAALRDEGVRLWRTHDWKQIALLRDPGYTTDFYVGGADMVLFTPDGKLLVTHNQGGDARLWDASTGEMLAVIAEHRARRVELSRSGRKVVVAFDHGAFIWDIASRSRGTVIPDRTDISSARLSPDETVLVTAWSDGTAQAWNAATGAPLALLSGHTGVLKERRILPGWQPRCDLCK